MFRIVTQFVEKPTFLLMCDNPSCACVLSDTILCDLTDMDGLQLKQSQFVGKATRAGWMVALNGIFCVGHTDMIKRLRDRAGMVQVAQTVPVVSADMEKVLSSLGKDSLGKE